MESIFKRLDKCDLEIKKEKRKKRYRLSVYNSLFFDGHIARMGDPTLTWLILGDKCTATVMLNGKVFCYLVYGGRYSDKIIDELAKIRGKDKRAIWRDLKRLKKEKRIDYETCRGVGTRIVVYPIEGVFERSFKATKDIGHNGTKQVPKRNLITTKMALDNYHNGTSQKGTGKESAKENKGNSEMAKNGSPCTRTYTKTKETMTTTSPVAAAISQIFKGRVKTDKVKDQIKGKNPDEVIALARYCQKESSAKNPVGLFFTMLKEGTKPPAPATKTRPVIPPPKGGYQSGDEPLVSPRQFVPEEVIVLFQQYGDAEHIVDNKLWKFLERYHKKHTPRDYYKDKDQLTPEEIANMLAMAEGQG